MKFVDISEKDMGNLKTFLTSLMDSRMKPKLDIPPRLLSTLGIKTGETVFEAFKKK